MEGAVDSLEPVTDACQKIVRKLLFQWVDFCAIWYFSADYEWYVLLAETATGPKYTASPVRHVFLSRLCATPLSEEKLPSVGCKIRHTVPCTSEIYANESHRTAESPW